MREDTVRLGLMPPLTGLVEMYGAEIARAGQIACDEVNESGGVLGRPLELVIEDDGSLPESAVAAAVRLVDQHRCAAIIGNLLSNSRIAVAYQVAEPRRIPYLNFSFYEGSILSHYFFHFAALPNQQIERMIPFMRKQYGPRMFFAGNNYEWPRGSIDAAKRALEQAGGLTVGEEYYPIGVDDGDIERLLDQVAKSGAEVFVPYFAGADQTHLLTRFTERGLKSRVAVVMGHYDEAMASRLPPEVREGFYSSNTYFMTLDTPENKQYLARLAAQPGVDGIWPQGNGILTNFGEGAYLCVKAFAKAANQAGSLDAEALVKALETISVSGPQGAVQMDPVTHHARVNTCLSHCQADGSFTIIERFGAIPPVLPERYRHLRISKQTGMEDIYLESRMMAQITEAVLLVHATDDTIVYANPGAERMFGYPSDELSGKRFSVLFAPSDKSPEETTAAIGKVLFRKGVWQGETENITRDGKRFWCAASISVFTHPEFGEVWMILNKDVTGRKQAENKLREKEERLALATIHNGVGIWDWNLITQEMIWDDSMYSLYHIRREDFIGTEEAWRAALHPDDLERGDREVNDAIAGIKPFDTEFRVVWPDGEIRHIKAVAKVFRDERGNPLRMLGINMDITELRRTSIALQEKSNLLHSIIDSSADYIFAKDRELRTVLCNKIFAGAVGKYAQDLIGKTDIENGWDPELVKGNAAKGIRGYEQDDLDAIAGKTIHSVDQLYVDGKLHYVDTVKLPLVDDAGHTFGMFGISRDITERKQAEENIRQLNSELEQRVIARTASLEAANKDLEGFAYSVAHDLRAPLRAIDGFSQLVLKRYEEKLDDEGKRLLNVVRGNTRRMGQLIDDILAFSRAGRLEIKASTTDMAALAREVWQELEPSRAEREVFLNIKSLPNAQGDRAMLRQVWANLLGNAVKFTRPKPTAQIEVEGKIEGAEYIYSIKDNGVGFDMQYADKLFGVFQRLHGIEEFEGTGIGLAIVKRIIPRHGGRVWAEGKANEGAAFYFALPVNPENNA